MADLNFPINPITGVPDVGQQYVIGTTTWSYNGAAWIKLIESSKKIYSLNIASFANALSLTDAPLVVEGGAGIGGDLYVGGDFYLRGSKVLTNSSFNGSTKAGVDIQIDVDEEAGTLTFNDVATLDTITQRGGESTSAITISNDSSSYNTMTGALIVTGGVGIGGNLNTAGIVNFGSDAFITGRMTSESIQIADAIFDSTAASVSDTQLTLIDMFYTANFRSAKYLVQISEDTGIASNFQVSEIVLLTNNNNGVFFTEYGRVTSSISLGEFSAENSQDMVRLYFTPNSSSNKTIKVLRTSMTT